MTESPPQAHEGDGRILVVDDETHIRRSLALFLEKKGYSVSEAEDGVEAVEKVAAEPYFLVLTDIAMPRMNGLATLKEVKALRPETEVVMITANLELDFAIEAMRRGAFDYLRKPFYLDEVILTVERVQEKQSLRRKALELELLREKQIVEQKAALDTTLGFVQAVEEKDRYTKGHSERVAWLSVKLARASGVPAHRLDTVRFGALLHDVGKIAIPREILNKAARLTDNEFLVIRKHPEIGERILQPISFLRDVLPMVRHHHESWDGRGYPDKLCGEEIPFEARIVKLADCYDAVTSNRAYRNPMSPSDALDMVRNEKGTSFDPELADHFVRIVEEVERRKTSQPGAAAPAAAG